MDCVTTLIGISVNNEAKVGIIGKYFSGDNNGGYQWDPRCYFALSDHPNLYYIDYLNNMEIKQLKPSIKKASEKSFILFLNKFIAIVLLSVQLRVILL